ncbi:MAG: M1 family metallopeptidase [Bacteroidales bacterium]|nr:M1 family metallopeptidase [Bacteroidales bacterium]
MKKFLAQVALFLISFNCLNSQFIPPSFRSFTRQDTLRGSITPERSWWDLNYYHLDISVNPSDSTIYGINNVVYTVLHPFGLMQIDLQEPMIITKALQNGRSLDFHREGSVYRIRLSEEQKAGDIRSLVLEFGGRPRVSERPPWEGGITWSKDSNGKPFIASSCQGDGASLWWPCKDHYYDEPDSMMISVTVPAGLINVSNGRLRSMKKNRNRTTTFNWFVANPINNYGVNINIADYAHFSEVFQGGKGSLDCDYYVLRENLEKAKTQFTQAGKMLRAFEHWFGPYPFYEDGYKLVEAPYLGMEHQSSVTYGNGYRNGYKGEDLSGTGWGDKFDFIIIHESGHEWFGNSITNEDAADMWIHESFTNYSESLFLEYYYGKEAASEYILGCRKRILNNRTITGIYNVNFTGSGDMYYKGGSMLHTLRQIIDDDEKWRSILRGLNQEFYHQVVKGSQIEEYLALTSGLDLKPFFDQYLRDTRIPVFEYYVQGTRLNFRWTNCVPDFNMPVTILISGKAMNITPTVDYNSLDLGVTNADIVVDPDFYVASLNITGK